jgi:ribosomal protein S18 acetylase RimI-like enzyme
MTIEQAVEAQIQSSLFMSSFGDHREVVKVGGLQVVRDAPGRKRPPRRESIIVSGVYPEEAVATVRAYGPSHWALCIVEPTSADHDALKEEYKALGYRLNIRFPFFVRDLERPVEVPHRFAIERVTDSRLADEVARVKGRKLPPIETLQGDDAKVRVYAAVPSDGPSGWVMSIRATRTENWVSDLYVLPEYRRRGLGEQLLRRMLIDDALLGVKHSVLLSSSDGEGLYRRLGYEQIGLMQIFTPVH